MDAEAILVEEYKTHRQEVIATQSAYNLQTAQFQVVSAIISVVALFSTKDSALAEGPGGQGAKLLILITAAAITFYLFALMLNSSQSFIVLRKRMAEIEKQINAFKRLPLLRYESEIAPIAFGRMKSNSLFPSPVAWAGFWRVSVFLSIMSFIIYGASVWQVGRPGTVLATLIILFASALTFQQFQTYFNYAHNPTVESQDYDSSLFSHVFYFCGVLFSILTIVGATYVLTYADAGFPSETAYLEKWNSQLKGWPATAKEFFFEQPMGVVSYVAAATSLPIPLPSEAPLISLERFGWPQLFVWAFVGKFFGTLILAFFASFMPHLVRDLLSRPAKQPSSLSELISQVSGDGTIGFRIGLSYFALQAIPFMPMRSSTFLLSSYVWLKHTGNPHPTIFLISLLSALAMPARMSLLYMLINLGVAVMPNFVV